MDANTNPKLFSKSKFGDFLLGLAVPIGFMVCGLFVILLIYFLSSFFAADLFQSIASVILYVVLLVFGIVDLSSPLFFVYIGVYILLSVIFLVKGYRYFAFGFLFSIIFFYVLLKILYPLVFSNCCGRH